jgi:hypothetical protein
MRLHFGKGFAVNRSQQADEMLPTIFTCDFGNIPRRVRRHYSWKFQIDLAGRRNSII